MTPESPNVLDTSDRMGETFTATLHALYREFLTATCPRRLAEDTVQPDGEPGSLPGGGSMSHVEPIEPDTWEGGR